jgi:nitrogen fixation protein
MGVAEGGQVAQADFGIPAWRSIVVGATQGWSGKIRWAADGWREMVKAGPEVVEEVGQ